MTSNPASDNKGFVFESAVDAKPNTVTGALEMKAYLVQYRDGENRAQTRLVFRVPGSNDAFILQERLSGTFVVTSANKWFANSLTSKLKESGAGGAAEESTEGATSL